MMSYVVTALIVAVALAGAIYAYLHGGPDGGRDPGLTRAQARERRRDADPGLADRLEQEFQAKQRRDQLPPTHEG